ncbi:hypothetical protein BT96DRAFT_959662 [Gymnopus androsaceus JB14]|uniref:FAS1 domain-containing protein n=1 Tax=Gymnopus androsaceus JB14 TaxID=1447944 RepID=A0A6A4GZL2_9AGAR|nr:hypothetical protein BT96DRAFT_959662 [Gymnopus androsaceus JB14]
MPSLADLLTIESSASVFYSYARELSLSEVFSQEREGQGLTLLVPTNKAVMALARKPHQGPSPANTDSDVTISEEEFERNSKDNVRRWVEAHIIPKSLLTFSKHATYDTLLEGKSISFISDLEGDEASEDWKKVAIEERINILSMRKASNGVMYLIDGTIDPESGST